MTGRRISADLVLKNIFLVCPLVGMSALGAVTSSQSETFLAHVTERVHSKAINPMEIRHKSIAH